MGLGSNFLDDFKLDISDAHAMQDYGHILRLIKRGFGR